MKANKPERILSAIGKSKLRTLNSALWTLHDINKCHTLQGICQYNPISNLSTMQLTACLQNVVLNMGSIEYPRVPRLSEHLKLLSVTIRQLLISTAQD